MNAFQLYLVAYARSQGMTPEAIMITRPRSWKLDFMIWIRGQWREYRKHIGLGPDDVLSPEQRDAFQAWLDGRVV